MIMVMFREGQLVKVSPDACEWRGRQGFVKMVESDGSAWVEITGRRLRECDVRHRKLRGRCVQMWPDECEPV